MSVFNRLRRLINAVGMPQISTICSREEFSCILERELARAERSNQIFSVVDFDIGEVNYFEINKELGKQLLQALVRRLRSTDEVGWLEDHHIGVLLYNTPSEGAKVFSKKILELFPKGLTYPDCKIYTYPVEEYAKDDLNYQGSGRRQTRQKSLFSPEVLRKKTPKPIREMPMLYPRAMPTWKRLMDVVGALFLLILSSPLFFLVALMIKIVSSGPVFFQQRRVGYAGKVFNLYKLITSQKSQNYQDEIKSHYSERP